MRASVSPSATVLAALALLATVAPALALEPDDVIGTWKLVSSTRKVLATGEVSDTYGPHPTGWVSYGRDGRMMVLIVHDGRPKPASFAATTDAERAALMKTMLAYAGTYSLSGNSITHTIDTSWNQTWTGTKVVRDVARRGDQLVYTTKPAPGSMDGKMSVVTLVWEKVK